ncbi:AAA family ATPase [Halobacteria archaeon AArc-curdl1]|uniref:AAA family ATPase n=1 Tax=Natronosalvus hydrolyticus TaxID=2979988 RepID=A0AAP3E732_9EURY|nr:AAA family ATPase [Halobacteria archaeon AArc-curdl1]
MGNKFDLTNCTDQNNTQRIISDDTKLDIGYVPEKIPHREHIIEELLNNTFAPVINENQGQHAILVGPPGTGKTVTIKHILQKVRENNDTSHIKTIYINCADRSSGQAVYEKLCDDLGLKFVRGQGLSKNITSIMEYINSESTPDLLVILDEIHELHSTRSDRDYLSRPVLYSLSRPHQCVSEVAEDGFKGNITFIGISNEANIIEEIAPDVKSSLSHATYNFKKYTEEEIVDILSQRQQEAYSEEILSKPALRKIAREIAQNFHGDIRKGIDILKNVPNGIESPSVVVDSQKKQIDVVESTIEKIQRDKIQQVFYSKDKHFYLVMSSLYQQLKKGKPHLKYVTQSYSKACEYAMVEKQGEDYKARKSFVYRQLEYLVKIGLLEKTKDYSEPKNPNCYEEIFNLEVFKEAVEDNLERERLLEKIRDQNLVLNLEEQEAANEAEEILDQHMNG